MTEYEQSMDDVLNSFNALDRPKLVVLMNKCRVTCLWSRDMDGIVLRGELDDTTMTTSARGQSEVSHEMVDELWALMLPAIHRHERENL